MYSSTLFIHSWMRWVVLILMVWLLVKALRGWRGTGEYSKSDNILRLTTLIVFDLQVVIGVIVYFTSPNVKVAFEPDVNFMQVMQDTQLRFIVVEHTFAMVIALIVLHAGNVFIKKADTSQKKFKRLAITIMVTLLIVLISIPWPFLPYGRVLFRPF